MLLHLTIPSQLSGLPADMTYDTSYSISILCHFYSAIPWIFVLVDLDHANEGEKQKRPAKLRHQATAYDVTAYPRIEGIMAIEKSPSLLIDPWKYDNSFRRQIPSHASTALVSTRSRGVDTIETLVQWRGLVSSS